MGKFEDVKEDLAGKLIFAVVPRLLIPTVSGSEAARDVDPGPGHGSDEVPRPLLHKPLAFPACGYPTN